MEQNVALASSETDSAAADTAVTDGQTADGLDAATTKAIKSVIR
eukprot:SAG31_NODE_31890_length_362_cov_1.680608_2_plen_43_part_01